MVASEFLDYITKYNFIQKTGLYDIIDRCTFLLTLSVFLLCSAIITIKSYVLEPMSCYVATEVSGANVMSYINNYCWVTGTYPKGVHQDSRDDADYWKSLESQKIHYYQWVPLVLGLQAALLYLPYVIWEAVVYNRLGTNLQFFIDAARRCSLDFGDSRVEKVKSLAGNIYVLLRSRKLAALTDCSYWKNRRFIRKLIEKKNSIEILSCYMILKVVALIVVIYQFVIMEKFLGLTGKYKFLGFTLLSDLLRNRHWDKTHLFPRRGFCQIPFKVHSSPNLKVTAQCSLSINMLNEKIFIFLWLWLCILSTMHILGLFSWIWRCWMGIGRRGFLTHALKVIDTTDGNSRQNDINHFRSAGDIVQCLDHDILSADGVFLLHMIRINCGDIICADLLKELIEMMRQDKSLSRNSRNQSNFSDDSLYDDKNLLQKNSDEIQMMEMEESKKPKKNNALFFMAGKSDKLDQVKSMEFV